MAHQLINFALTLFGGPTQLILYVLTHSLGTERGTALFSKILPLIQAELATNTPTQTDH